MLKQTPEKTSVALRAVVLGCLPYRPLSFKHILFSLIALVYVPYLGGDQPYRSSRDINSRALRLNAIVFVGDLVGVISYSFILGADLVVILKGLVPLLLFIEAGLVFLAGGFSVLFSTIFFTKVREHVFHSEERWSMDRYRHGEKGALPCILVRTMLFGESLLLAFV